MTPETLQHSFFASSFLFGPLAFSGTISFLRKTHDSVPLCLKEAAAFPDSNSKMNFHFAKAPFTLNTLSEMVGYVHFQLGYGTPLFSQLPKMFYYRIVLLGIENQDKRSPWAITAHVTELKRIATFDASESSRTAKSFHTAKPILTEVTTLKYYCAVHDIFEKLFMATAENWIECRILRIS
jgi:hypothetical protein